MAAPRIIRTRSAENDLATIWDYVAAEASPEIADFVLARLFEAMNRAAQFPLIYPQTEYGQGSRRVNVFEYAIFYKPLPEGGDIRVRRVIHGRRNIALDGFRRLSSGASPAGR